MLNNKKIEFHLFSVADYEEEQTYLRENHKKGLKLIKYIMPSMYIFEKMRSRRCDISIRLQSRRKKK